MCSQVSKPVLFYGLIHFALVVPICSPASKSEISARFLMVVLHFLKGRIPVLRYFGYCLFALQGISTAPAHWENHDLLLRYMPQLHHATLSIWMGKLLHQLVWNGTLRILGLTAYKLVQYVAHPQYATVCLFCR